MKTLYEMQNGNQEQDTKEYWTNEMAKAAFRVVLFAVYLLIIFTAAVPVVLALLVSPWFLAIYPALLALTMTVITVRGGKKE